MAAGVARDPSMPKLGLGVGLNLEDTSESADGAPGLRRKGLLEPNCCAAEDIVKGQLWRQAEECVGCCCQWKYVIAMTNPVNMGWDSVGQD